MKKNKSYNPLEMQGSWIGGFLFFLTLGFLIIPPANEIGGFLQFTLGFGTFTIGFLIGWGIHSLIRSLRK